MHSPSQTALAKQLGLSQGTVSRALRNDLRIAEETRKRVWNAAEAMGYRPSVAISSFASKAHWTSRELRDCPLAYLWQPEDQSRSQMSSLRALEIEAARRGFRITAINLREERNMPALARRLYNQGVQGLLLNYIRHDPSWFSQFPFDKFAVISGEVHYEHEPITTIRHQQRRPVLTAYRRMRQLGYRRIGAALLEPGEHPDDSARIGGFCSEQAHWNGFPETALLHLIRRELPEDRQRRQFLDWITREKPEGIILTGGREHGWLKQAGLCPAHVGCTAVFGQTPSLPGPNLETPEVAGFIRDWLAIARTTIETIEQMIRLRRYGFQEHPTLISIPPTWVEGRSLPERSALQTW